VLIGLEALSMYYCYAPLSGNISYIRRFINMIIYAKHVLLKRLTIRLARCSHEVNVVPAGSCDKTLQA